MMVVMSPMGLQAPPALAASTMTQAKIQRSFWSRSMRLSIITIIMVVVMLSRMLDMKKATSTRIHISFRLSEAWMCFTMIWKPP